MARTRDDRGGIDAVEEEQDFRMREILYARERIGFDVVPVRTIDGSVAYGVVMAAAERPVVDVGTV